MKAGKSRKKSSPDKFGRLRIVAENVEKLLLLILPVIMIISILYVASTAFVSIFKIKSFVLSGNEHLTDEELKTVAGLKGDENLAGLSSKKIYARIMESPWVRSASIRKEFPSKLHIMIKEAEPFALLDMKNKLFIVDDNGRMLEELKESSVPFLPVILSDPYNEKDAFYDAVNLAKAIKGSGLLQKSDRIEIIAHKKNEIAANLDGVLVKVGSGEYSDKLARLIEIQEEIKKRKIPVDYIDLRFAKKVVVKPVNEVIR